MLRRCTPVLVVMMLVACSEDDQSTAADDAAIAVTVCGALRDQANSLVRIANRAVAGIETRAPDDRLAAILDGFDDARLAAVAFQRNVEELQLPDVPERDSLRAQLTDGAAAAVREVDDERARFERTGPTVEDADTRGRVGEFFNSVEKVMSVVEPTIATYERRSLQRAFLDEPTCEHVIQPFQVTD